MSRFTSVKVRKECAVIVMKSSPTISSRYLRRWLGVVERLRVPDLNLSKLKKTADRGDRTTAQKSPCKHSQRSPRSAVSSADFSFLLRWRVIPSAAAWRGSFCGCACTTAASDTSHCWPEGSALPALNEAGAEQGMNSIRRRLAAFVERRSSNPRDLGFWDWRVDPQSHGIWGFEILGKVQSQVNSCSFAAE